MTVGELKKILEKINDSMVVMIPVDDEGMFITPCIEESGIDETMLNEDAELEPTFVLVPCGFYCEMDEEIDPQMN